jgi:diaminopimelate epimerase
MTSLAANAPLSFRKMNGLGNEIVVVDLRGSKRVVSADEARAVAADPLSRFDQLMVLHDPRTRGTEAYIRIYNTDGSEAEACGNGMRCVGWLAFQALHRERMKFETRPGILDVAVVDDQSITVDMGSPRFTWNEIPLAEPFHDTKRIELQIGPIDDPILHSPSVVNVGNPHCVFWVTDVAAYDLGRFGPMLENHPIFPERANISLAAVTSPTTITLRTWERGAGLTRACGSAACAAGVLGAHTRRTERKVTVHVPGGPLLIEWTQGNRIRMTGPATDEYPGVFDFSVGRAQRLS